jgi:hypothetical protein
MGKGLVLLGKYRECGNQKLRILPLRRQVRAANIMLFMTVDANRKPGKPNHETWGEIEKWQRNT